MKKYDIMNELEDLRKRVERIERNEIPYLRNDVDYLKERTKRHEEGVITGITILFWVLTPIAFLSAPLMGIVCLGAAIFCTYGLWKKKHVNYSPASGCAFCVAFCSNDDTS